jgi:hypothetical protein
VIGRKIDEKLVSAFEINFDVVDDFLGIVLKLREIYS